jgi:capsular polysaccharide biosynthesis protein
LCKHLRVGIAADPAPVRELADYTRPIRRRWRWVAVGVAVGLVLGLVAAALVRHDYTSTASVVVTPTGVETDINNVNGRTQDVINLDTEAQIVKSDAVAARVRRVLQAHTSLAAIERRVSVTVPANTTVLRISYTGGSPHDAAVGAQAYATSYLAVRGLTATRLLRKQETAVRNQMASVAADLAVPSAGTGTSGRGASERAVRYRALATESNALAKQLSVLTTTVVTPGSVISGASTPSGGSRRVLFLLSGAMLGLLLSAGIAVARERTDTRLRDPRDLEEAGIHVVGSVDTPSSAMRAYTRAGNAILATLPDRGVVLVTGPTWEARNEDVAWNVATAIRDVAGSVAVVRVENGGAELTPLGAGGEAARGSRKSASAKLPGSFGAATRGELRQSVARLKEDTVVVVDAADPLAEAVLPTCDTALLVASMNATHVPDVVDAAREMEREGVRVIGALVVPDNGRAASGRWPLDSAWRGAGKASDGSEALPARERRSSQV